MSVDSMPQFLRVSELAMHTFGILQHISSILPYFGSYNKFQVSYKGTKANGATIGIPMMLHHNRLRCSAVRSVASCRIIERKSPPPMTDGGYITPIFASWGPDCFFLLDNVGIDFSPLFAQRIPYS